MSININEVNYLNYGKCISIKNDVSEMIVSIEFGPKIVFWGYINGENLLLESSNVNDSSTFGHYLWLSTRTTTKDYNDFIQPIVYSISSGMVRFDYPKDILDNMYLSMEIILSNESADAMVIHRVKNLSSETKSISITAHTHLKNNGFLILPQNDDDTLPFPNRCIALWPYTRLNDPRLFLGNKFITISYNSNLEYPFKIGINNRKGWACYLNDNIAFIKRYVHNQGARYPDFGCSIEAYTNSHNINVNSTSPFYITEHKEIVKHVENWSIFDAQSQPQINNEKQIEEFINNLK